jgi:glycerol uptake facilitator-like aquaporin
MSKIAVSEFIATAFLLIAVVGSGIAAENLSGGNTAVALLANALATGCALFVLIVVFAPLSGAHMNPLVTLAAAVLRELEIKAVPVYLAAQVAGAVMGVVVAHLMFDLPVVQASQHVRTGAAQWLAEVVAVIGLLGVVWGTRRHGLQTTAASVALYITGAYWFTASTSFANPAVTLARAMTDTFAGIRPIDAPGFMLAQIAGLVLVLPLLRRVPKQ